MSSSYYNYRGRGHQPEAFEEEVIRENVTIRRLHHQRRWEGITTRLAREVGKMAAYIRNMAQQRSITQRLLVQMHEKIGYKVSQQGASQREEWARGYPQGYDRDSSPMEGKVVCPQPPRDLVITCHKGQEISPQSIPKYRNCNDPSVSSTRLDHKGLENRSQLSPLDQRHQGYGQGSTPQEVRLPRDRLEKRAMRNLLNQAGTLQSPSY